MKRIGLSKPGPMTVFGKSLLIAAPLIAAALFYVWAEITTVRLGYKVSEASDAHRTLLEENRGLRIEVAALRAPERLKRLAEERYGLEAPKTEQVVRLELRPGASLDRAAHAEVQAKRSLDHAALVRADGRAPAGAR